jgi:VanZ family protein
MTSRIRLALLAALLLTLVVALTPVGPSLQQGLMEVVGHLVGPRPLAAGLNVLLFVPLGAAIRYWGRPWALLAAPVLSVGIELTQLTMSGRNADPVDVVANTLGAAIGYAVAHAILARRKREHVQNPPAPSFWPMPPSGSGPAPRTDHEATRTGERR